ncbi:MAG: phage tail protein [Clostridium sp.]|nr:phage tail protein [Clostridium sp.]
MANIYPYAKYRFTVEIEGISVAGFSEASGFDASIEVIKYREGNMPQTELKVAGLKSYSNITLKKGTTDNMDLYKWMIGGTTAAVQRKTITITIHDEDDKAVASWQVINAWPCKYTAPDFNATSNEIAIETLEIAHEGLTRTK